MNILVIGNGFDLAHGLPTKYTDFLKFVGAVRYNVSEDKMESDVIAWKKLNLNVKTEIKRQQVKSVYSLNRMYKDLIKDNDWIDFFYRIQCTKKKTGLILKVKYLM